MPKIPHTVVSEALWKPAVYSV